MNSYLACDHCEEWFHFECVGINECPPEEAD